MSESELAREAEERLVRELRGLAEGPPPPSSVERRLVERLRAQDLLASRRVWPRRLLAAAVAVALFAGGLIVGRSTADTPAERSPAPRFALFLLGGVDPVAQEATLVEEYRAWAVGLARSGRLVRGEKLGPSAWLLAKGESGVSLRTTPVAHRSAPLSGFFLLTTDDLDEALAIARSCPHLRHGGEVLLRPIEPT